MFLTMMVLNFNSGISITITLVLIVFLKQNIKKSLLIMLVSLLFFHSIVPNLTQVLSLRPRPLCRFLLTPNEIVNRFN